MWKRIAAIAFAIIFLSSIIPLRLAMGQATTISIQPAGTFGLQIGDTFSVNITVSNVTDLYAWKFYLYYQSSVLNGTEPIVEGPFLTAGSVSTFFVVTDFTDNYNATHGYMYVSCTRTGNVTGVDGDGTLATVSFKVKGSGFATLHLNDTKLLDSAEPFGNIIAHTTIDGSAYVGLVHVSVSGIRAPTDNPQGSVARINVTAENQGTITETFDVTLYAEDDPIETKSVINLPGGESQILNFTWDTTPIAIGEYTLNATATMVPGETDTTGKSLTTNVYVGTRDLAVTAVKPDRTAIPIGFPGIDVLVTVQNNGQATETFNVTLSYGAANVGNLSTALISGGSGTSTFTWNTSILNYGNYSLRGAAPPLPYETHTSDNNLTRYAVVTIPGDTNADRTVDIYDAIVLAAAYEANPGNPNWNPNADINGDNIIDIYDAIILSSHYGQSI